MLLRTAEPINPPLLVVVGRRGSVNYELRTNGALQSIVRRQRRQRPNECGQTWETPSPAQNNHRTRY